MTGPIAKGSIRRRLFLQLSAIAALLSLTFFLVVRGVAERVAEDTQDDILAASATAIADSLRSDGAAVTLQLPYSALSMLGTINEDRVFYHGAVDGATLTGYADLSRITSTATAIGVGFFLVATALSLLAARTALLPLHRMTGAMTRRGPQDLRPVKAETPAELVPFVDALNSFMARLRASLSRSEDFIAEAAHRVRTPLATVRAQAELTYRKLDDPDQKHSLREMIRAIDESSRSAGQMLDHAMVTFRTDALAGDDLNLSEIMAETCDRLTPTADLKDIEIRRSIANSPHRAKGDGILLQSALANILDNAIKYSPEDSVIDSRLVAGDDIRLSFTDQGRGFGDTDLDGLTTRFARGSNVGDIVGSGLGLTIADEVIRAHGGRLEIARNKEGKGACVSLILPRP